MSTPIRGRGPDDPVSGAPGGGPYGSFGSFGSYGQPGDGPGGYGPPGGDPGGYGPPPSPGPGQYGAYGPPGGGPGGYGPPPHYPYGAPSSGRGPGTLPPGVEIAPLGKRVLAGVTPGVLFGVLYVFATALRDHGAGAGAGLFGLLYLAYAVWGLVLWGRGQTPTLVLFGMRCWIPAEGRVPGWGVMALREIVGAWIIETWTLGIGAVISLVVMLVRADHKCLHDLVARTIVVNDPRGVLGR